MPESWHTLPLVVLSNIFDQVGSVPQIARCRLVCKQWNSPAEMALYRQNLVFLHVSRLGLFYHRLKEKPSLGRLIQHLRIDVIWNKIRFKKGLFRLAFTPNTRVIIGRLHDDIYELLLSIAQKSKHKFKLERLPHEYVLNHLHATVYLYFKSTSKALDLDLRGNNMEAIGLILERLDEFTSLEELTLQYEKTLELKQLDTIFDKCSPLRIICIKYDDLLAEGFTHSWTKEHVAASSNRCVVDLRGVKDPRVVEYFVAKYPNAFYVAVGSRGHFSPFKIHSIRPFLEALKDVECVDITPWKIQEQEDWREFISAMKSSINHVTISFCGVRATKDEYTGSAMKDRKQDTTTFHLRKPNEPKGLGNILQMIGTTTTLDIDCTNYKDDTEYTPDEQRIFLFYKVLKLVPEIQQLTFSNDNVQLYLPCLTEDLHMQHLSKLTFCGALVDPALLLALDRFAPNLERLSLVSCILNFTSHQDYCIIMPHSNLESLSIAVKSSPNNSAWDEYSSLNTPVQGLQHRLEWIQERISINKYQLVVMEVTTFSNRKALHLALKPGKPTLIKRIPQDEYLENAAEWPNIVIKCNSLKWVKLNLGDLVVNISLNTLRPIQSMDEWEGDKQHALLKSMHESLLGKASPFFSSWSYPH